MDNLTQPTIERMSTDINSPIFDELRKYIEQTYKVLPKIEYSCCSMERGWNIKYKKSSRSLCTIYPRQGFVTCMISIGSKEEAHIRHILPGCTEYVQQLYYKTPPSKMGRWLMIDLKEQAVLEDIKALLKLRAGR